MDVANPNDDNPNSDPVADIGSADEASAGSHAGDANPEDLQSDTANSTGGKPDDTLDTEEIEALLRAQSDASLAPAHDSHAEQLLRQAEADLAAAVAPDLNPAGNAADLLRNAEQFQFQEFGTGSESADLGIDLQSLQDVELDLRIELGRAELLIEDVLQLKEGAVVPLDKLAGDPVDILVNGRLIARGEVLVLNDNFCVRVSEILEPDQ